MSTVGQKSLTMAEHEAFTSVLGVASRINPI